MVGPSSKSISLDCSVRPGHYPPNSAGSFEVSGALALLRCPPGVRVSGHLSRDGSLGWGRPGGRRVLVELGVREIREPYFRILPEKYGAIYGA